MATFLICGLWHGASWMFVLWGAFHGIFLCAEHLFPQLQERATVAGPATMRAIAMRVLRVLWTFHVVCFSWLIFRAGTFSVMKQSLAALASPPVFHGLPPGMVLAFCLIFAGFAMQVLGEWKDYAKGFSRLPIPAKSAVYAAVTAALAIFGSASEKVFIYFRF
jgi:hypothetical protein